MCRARNKFIPVLQQGDSTHVAMMLSRPDFSACPLEQVDKFKGSASRAVPKLQHLPRWGLPPASLPSPAGNNSARSTIINTARSVVINGGAVGHEWPQPDANRNGFAGKAHDAAPSQREDVRKCAASDRFSHQRLHCIVVTLLRFVGSCWVLHATQLLAGARISRFTPLLNSRRLSDFWAMCSGADSGLDGGRTWDSDSLKQPRGQVHFEMTPRDTANSTVRAGGEAADLGQMHTRSKRLRNTASETVLHQVRSPMVVMNVLPTHPCCRLVSLPAPHPGSHDCLLVFSNTVATHNGLFNGDMVCGAIRLLAPIPFGFA